MQRCDDRRRRLHDIDFWIDANPASIVSSIDCLSGYSAEIVKELLVAKAFLPESVQPVWLVTNSIHPVGISSPDPLLGWRYDSP